MEYFFLVFIFLFGVVLGSFLLVIASRYNTGLPFLRGRSVCFSCNTQLENKDLVPIFSFLFLKGRCRHCGSKIPKEALLVEILMGVLSVLTAFKSGLFIVPSSIIHTCSVASPLCFGGLNLMVQYNFSWLLAANYLLLVAIFGVLLLITLYDLKHFIIPDSFLLFLLVFSFLYALSVHFGVVGALNFSWILLNIIFSLVITLPFLLIFLISRGTWFGFGDVKFIAVLAFWLGAVNGLSGVILAFWLGAAFTVSAFLFKKNKHSNHLPGFINNLTIKSEIPFGPFLSLGAIISFLFNLDLFQINALLNLF